MSEALVLASASPRRRSLLAQVGLEADVIPADVDEARYPDEAPEVFAERMAMEKAEAVARRLPGRWVLGADTVVTLDGDVLGKPRDDAEAFQMLSRLVGRRHDVITGVAILRLRDASSESTEADRGGDVVDSGYVRTRVRFRDVPAAVLRGYVQTGEGADKAGAYGIQGVGGGLVARVEGCYFNVVGLPISDVLGRLERLGALRGWPASTVRSGTLGALVEADRASS